MLQINLIRENSQEIVEKLNKRGFDASSITEKILDVDKQRRATQKKLDDTLAESKSMAKEIGTLFKTGKQDEANALKEKTSQIKAQVKEMQDELARLENEQNEMLVLLPNLPHESVKASQPEQPWKTMRL